MKETSTIPESLTDCRSTTARANSEFRIPNSELPMPIFEEHTFEFVPARAGTSAPTETSPLLATAVSPEREQSPLSALRSELSFWAETPGALLAGVDEAGRGCLAGPVVAGAVSIDEGDIQALATTDLARVNDSKQLTEKQREALFEVITHHPLIRVGVGIATAAEIDKLNILRATHLAMRRALEALPTLPAHALIDGLPVKGLPIPHTPIVKGDAKSLLIACASIVAKVTRDHICLDLDKQYPQYGFAKHKTYGTKAHLKALHTHGPCPEHRRSFAPVAIIQEEMVFE